MQNQLDIGGRLKTLQILSVLLLIATACRPRPESVGSDLKVGQGLEIFEDLEQDPKFAAIRRLTLKCTLFFISDSVALSAAHCAFDYKEEKPLSPSKMFLDYDNHNTALRYFVHPKWPLGSLSSHINDVAIIEFPKGTSSTWLGISTLENPRWQPVSMVGYGELNLDTGTDLKKRVGFNRLEAVDDALVFEISGAEGKPANEKSLGGTGLHGDSGGPLMDSFKNVLGVASGGKRGGKSISTRYAPLFLNEENMKFIVSKLASEDLDVPGAFCDCSQMVDQPAKRVFVPLAPSQDVCSTSNSLLQKRFLGSLGKFARCAPSANQQPKVETRFRSYAPGINHPKGIVYQGNGERQISQWFKYIDKKLFLETEDGERLVTYGRDNGSPRLLDENKNVIEVTKAYNLVASKDTVREVHGVPKNTACANAVADDGVNASENIWPLSYRKNLVGCDIEVSTWSGGIYQGLLMDQTQPEYLLLDMGKDILPFRILDIQQIRCQETPILKRSSDDWRFEIREK